MQRGADLWRQVEPHLSRAVRRRRGHPAPSLLGHILPTAHDMGREYRVLTALRDTPVPVPRTFYLGTADSALAAPFYVMERVLGHICRDALPLGYAVTAEDRAAIGAGLIGVLAALHTVDPEQVGLEISAGRKASWTGSCAAGPNSGCGRRPAICPRSTRCATSSPRRCPRSRRRHRPRRLSLGQHAPAPQPPGRHRRGARLGDEHARRSTRGSRRPARVLERSGRRRGAGARPHRRAGDCRVRLPQSRRGGRAVRARDRTMSRRSAGTRRLRSSSSP